MKRILALVLALCLVLAMVPAVSAAQVVESGSCGVSATYQLYSDGRLVIGGSGAVDEWAFAENTAITAVEIRDGITQIGDFAFSGCTGISRADLGETLQIIGAGAFCDCIRLERIVIPDSVTSLNGGRPMEDTGLGVFEGCKSLEHITIGSGVSFIPNGFLNGSEKLETLILPENITALSAYAFAFNPRLTYVQIPAGVTYIGSMAFVNDFSLTTVVFEGPAPQMDSAFYCGSFNIAGFYPQEDPSWADGPNILATASINGAVPYSMDSQGKILPQFPENNLLVDRLHTFQWAQFSAGSRYPDNYSYIINGNFLTFYGDEAFAVQLSDALCDYLPISEKRDVVFSDLSVGDILYLGDETCVITALGENEVNTAGVDQNETVYYDKVLTRAQAEAADACRTRCGVAPYPGVTDPAVDFELTDLPTKLPTQEEVYEKILALQETFPEGMPYSSKNHFHSKTEAPVYDNNGPSSPSMSGHGCSAFGYYVSDLCFGKLPARYIPAPKMSYENLRVGDSLVGFGHQVVILEVLPEHVVVAEGNYDGIIHWFRTLTREEVQGSYDVYTRYPDGYPFADVTEDGFYCSAVMWAVRNNVTTGTSATTFSPAADCNRAAVVTFLWRAAGSPEPETTEHPFVDVPKGSFFEKAVLWAVENGITNGVDATHFGPAAACNRATVVTFLYRAMGEPEFTNTASPFTDVTAGSWYASPVLWAVEKGITNGMGNGTFGVGNICNRAQVVTFLHRTYVN